MSSNNRPIDPMKATLLSAISNKRSKSSNTWDEGWCIVQMTVRPSNAIVFSTCTILLAINESKPVVGSSLIHSNILLLNELKDNYIFDVFLTKTLAMGLWGLLKQWTVFSFLRRKCLSIVYCLQSVFPHISLN